MEFVKTIVNDGLSIDIYKQVNKIEFQIYRINKNLKMKLTFNKINDTYVIDPVDIENMNYLADYDVFLFVFGDILDKLERISIINQNQLTSNFLLGLL